MKQLTVNGKERFFPENWQELATMPQHLIYILNLFFIELSQYQLETAATIRLLELSNVTEYRVQKAIENHPEVEQTQITMEGIYRASELLKWLNKVEPTFEVNPFPVLMNKYYATDNVLRDFTLWEFQLAENSMRKFMETKNETDLNEALAVLYRPKKFLFEYRELFGDMEPDCRVKFNDQKTDRYAKRIATLPVGQKYACLLWFVGQLKWIYKHYSYLFGKSAETNNDGKGWLDVVFMMTTAGNEEQAAETKISIILERLAYNYREAEKMKQTQ